MESNTGQRVWGSAVDDVISRDLYGTGGEPTGDSPFGSGSGQDPVKSTVAALTIIEKHLVPVRHEDLGAVALLRMEAANLGPDGQVLADIAELWMSTHHMRGGAGPLLQALENATAMRQFKGATGQIVRGYGGAPGQGGGYKR